MLNRFIDAALAVLLSALVTGCATSGSAPEGEPARQPPIEAATVGPGLLTWIPDEPAPDAGVSLPKVNRGTATLFEQAVGAMRAGRMREAEVLLLEITADQPELAGPWINLGRIYVAGEQFEEARLAFNNAISANPASCVAHNQLGVLSRRFGDFASAEQHYRACLERVPNYRNAYLNLGILYELYLGRLPEALEAYRRYQALAEEPDRKVQGWVVDLERRIGS